MNKKLLGSAVAAALGISFSGTASALVDLDAGTNVALFAQEIPESSTEGYILLPTANSVPDVMNATVKMGVGFSADTGEAIYIRFDLNDGVATAPTWNADLTTENLAIAGSNSISITSGGTSTDNYVVFSVAPTTGGSGFVQTTGVTLDLHDSLTQEGAAGGVGNYRGVTLSSKETVNLKYRIYASINDAIAGAGGPLHVVESEFIRFEPLLGLSASPNAVTAEVTTDFKEFSTSIAPVAYTTSDAKIGQITFGEDPNQTVHKADVVIATLGNLGITDASLVVTGEAGDFTAASSVWLRTDDGDCLAATTSTTTEFQGVISDDKASVTFGVGTSSGTYALCYTADGANEIPERIFSATYVDDSVSNAAQILHNGAELLAPFSLRHIKYVTRYYLTNKSNSPAAFTVEAQADQGVNGQGTVIPACTLNAPYDDCANDTTGACEIPANSNLMIRDIDLLATGQRCAVTFRVAASERDVHGHYSNKAKGQTDFDSYLMISIGSDSGH